MSSNFQSIISETSRSLKIPLYTTLVIETISNLQIVSIILDNAFASNIETNDFPSRFARHISSFISSTEVLTLEASQALLQTIWVIFAVYLTLLILWIILLTVIRSRSPTSLRKVFFKITSIAYLVHSRIIFFIIQYFFMGLIDSYTNCDDTDDGSFECHTVWIGFTILFCIINFGVALFKELIVYDINKSKRNTYAVKCNTFHKLVLLHKALAITVYFVVQDPSTTRQINAGINIVLLFVSLLILYIKLPFYSITPMKASITTTGIALSLSLISVLGVAGVEKEIIGIIWVALTPLIVKTLLICFNQLSHRIMEGNFRSPERAIHFIRLLSESNFGHVTPSIYATAPIYLGGVISNGILAQKKINIEALMESKSKKDHEEKMYGYMLERLNPILDKNPTSELLLLFMAKIYFKKLENIPKAIALLKRVEALSLSIPVRNSVDAFNIKVMETYLRQEYEGRDEKLHLLDYFKERALANSVKEDIQYEVLKQIEFWEELRRDKTNVRKVIELAGNIEVTSTRILSKWQNQIHGKTTYLLNPLIMYGAYIEIIREQSDEAKKLLQRFWNLSNNTHDEQVLDVYSDEDAVVLVSLEKINHGAIIEASGSAQILFGREKNMLIGQSISSLVPSIVGDTLLKVLENYATKPAGKLDYKVQSYGRTLSGEFFEADIHLKLFPEVSRQVRIMVIFHRLSTYKPLIITDRNGTILDCTDCLKKTFDFGTTATGGAVNMKKIVPTFQIINDAFNYMQDFNKYQKENVPKSPTAQVQTPTKILEKRNSYHHLKVKPESPGAGKRKTIFGTEQDMGIDEIALDAHRNVYEEFMQGSKLKFNLLQKGFEPSNDDIFEVQITPYEFNDKTYKIIALTLQEERKNVSKILVKEITTIVDVETLFSEFAADFPEANERNPEELGPNKKFQTHLTLKAQEGSLGFDRRLTRLTDNTEDNSKMPKIKTLQSSTPVKKDDSGPEGLIEKVKLDFRENSVSSTSSRTVASIRALKSLFNKSQSYTLARRTTIVIFLMMVFMIALAATNFTLSQKAIEQVQTGVTIINYASLRLSQSLRTWQVATRFFLRKVQLRSGQVQSLKDSGYTSGIGMLDQNKLLLKELSMNIDEDFVHEVAQDEVSLWMPYQNETLSGGQVDTFMAANTLANYMLRVTNTSEDTESDKILNYVQFVANNSGNDYLIASEGVITLTQEMLQVLISNNISNLQLVLGLQIAALFALCFSLIIAVRVVLLSYRKLFRALVKIDEKNINNRLNQIHKVKILLSEDLDTKKFGATALGIMRPNEKDGYKMKAKSLKKGGFNKIEEKMNMKGLLSQLVKYVGFSLLIIQIITVLFITSLLKSIANFRSLENVNNQLSVTTRVAYQSSAVISIFYVEIIWRNDTTMLVRNEFPAYQVEKSIQALTNVNNDLISVFSEEGSGITDLLIKEVLEATVCKFLSNDTTLQGYCDTATAGGDLGILGINSKFYMTAESYKNIYFSNPTYDTAKSIIDAYVAIMRPAAETIEAALQFINTHILDNFDQNISDFNTQTAVLHLGILISILFSTCVIQTIGVKKLRALDMCRGIILRVMPLQVLLEDKAIAFYLNKHFISTNNALSKIL